MHSAYGHRVTIDRTIASFVHQHAEKQPARIALEVWDEKDGVTLTVSFKELSNQVHQAAEFLQQAGGLRAGDRCAFLSHNTVAYVCASLGAQELGATSVNLSWRQPDDVNLTLVKELGAKLLIASKPYAELARRAQGEAPGIRMLLFESVCATPLDKVLPFATTLLRSSARPPPSDGGAPAPALVFFTGGTTGLPKSVPHTHDSVLAMAQGYLDEHGAPLDPDLEERAGSVCFTPYFHVMGYVCCLVANLVAGARSAILASPDAKLSPSLMVAACRTLRPTVLHTVPWVVEGLVQMIHAGNDAVLAELTRLRSLTYGGAALPEELARALSTSGVTLQCAYGQTELSGPVLYGKAGSIYPVYRPLKGIGYELVRGPDDGPDEGELVLLGARSATLGYLAMPSRAEKPPSLSRGGRSTHERYHTNDRFERVRLPGLEGEWLRYLCRNDDLLTHTSGEMTNPLITEQAILAESKGFVSEGGAVLCGTGMTRPVLVVELPTGASSDDTRMRAVLREAVTSANAMQPSYSAVLPQHVWLVPFGSLQRTVKGTIQRKPVEKMLLANSLPDGAEKLEGGSGDDDVRAIPLGCRWTASIPFLRPVCVRTYA